jgi:hypothetical protein
VLGNDVTGAPGPGMLLTPREIYMQDNDIELVDNTHQKKTFFAGNSVQVSDFAHEKFGEVTDQVIHVRDTNGINNLNAGITASNVGASDFNSGNSIGFTADEFALQDATGGSKFQSQARILRFLDAGTNVLIATLDTNSAAGTKGNFATTGNLTTGNPGSGAGAWLLGAPVAAAVVLDATRYVEVKINGVIVKLAIVN